MRSRPIGIDLFSGAGGLSLGFEQAGFEVVAAVEVDPVHAATHKFNFPNCAVLPRSVIGLTGTEIRNAAGLGRKRIDVVFGGAPCQGFSLIGQRALDDPRNHLVAEFVRIVAELKASYFVFENVKGLTLGTQRRFLEELVEAFAAVGYEVRTPWRVLNASRFGVPQNRERLILIGGKKGLPLPEYPSDSISIDPPMCRDALGDLPNAERFETLKSGDCVKTVAWGKPSTYSSELRCLSSKDWHYGQPREWNPLLLTSSRRTTHTEISRRRFRETAEGTVEPISRFFKLAANGLSNTLRAGTDAARGAFTSPRPIHYKYARCVTVREMARLHGFPDWFRFQETKWHGARQIGNAVPPPLARAVASEVFAVLGVKPTQHRKVLELGDPTLLAMDVSESAAYWGVPPPVGRRDRKSGAKKRKQADIEAALASMPKKTVTRPRKARQVKTMREYAYA